MEKNNKRKKTLIISIIVGAVVLLALLALVLGIIISLICSVNNTLSKLSTTDVSKYAEEYDAKEMYKFDIFPKEIPAAATDIEFFSSSGFQSGEGGFYLEYSLPGEDIEEYFEKYQDGIFIETDYSRYPEKVQKFVGATGDNQYKLSTKRYWLYSDYETGRGFVVDIVDNRVLIFYDRYKCGNY